MDPEYDIARLGYPDQLGTFTAMVDDVTKGGEPLVIKRYGRPVAVVVNLADLALLRRLATKITAAQSDETVEPE